MEGSAAVEIRAPAGHIYDLVSDITRMGEWSPECYRCEWVGTPARAEPGARFKGYNRYGVFRWSNTSEIVIAVRGQELAWIMGGTEKKYALWRYTFEPDAQGTLVTESFKSLSHTFLGRLSALPLGGEHRRQRVLCAGIETTLARIKNVAEA